MSEQVELTNPVDLSVGGMSGHIFRRIFHISMFIIPYIYFEFGDEVAERIDYTLPEVVSLVLIVARLETLSSKKSSKLVRRNGLILSYVFNSLLMTIFLIFVTSLANAFEIRNINIIKNLIFNRYK